VALTPTLSAQAGRGSAPPAPLQLNLISSRSSGGHEACWRSDDLVAFLLAQPGRAFGLHVIKIGVWLGAHDRSKKFLETILMWRGAAAKH